MSRRNYKSKNQKSGNAVPALLDIIGTLILVFVIAICVPLTVPRLFGYEIFNVISGSMEPEIPVGSAVYIKAIDPVNIEAGDIIAYTDGDSTVTHRVIENRKFAGKLVTKGDANPSNDFEPVEYDDVQGRVERYIPYIGSLMSVLSDTVGKLYMLCLACCGVMFNMLASRIRRFSQEKKETESTVEKAPPVIERSSKYKKTRKVIITIALIVFIASAGGTVYINMQYKEGEDFYDDAASKFTTPSRYGKVQLPQIADDLTPAERPKVPGSDECAPIEVDFEALQEINPDIIAWLYCPGTVINYPILHGEDNDEYLHRRFDRRELVAGSIFIDAANSTDFSDPHTIFYGHNMTDKSMFATLEYWQYQEYFDKHPVMWLLTPDQDYKVLLFSAYNTSAYSDEYVVFENNGYEFDRFLTNVQENSKVQSNVELYTGSNYVLFSTCAYVFKNARAVVYGMLQPLSSAGGVAMDFEA